MTAYYNESNPHAAEWLRNLIKARLIADGHVDDRSIVSVQPHDLRGFKQAHFFAGIGGWSYALRLAGWPDNRPVWTGSCPCQPFSEAGQRKGFNDERDLWPDWFRLIRECRPAIAFGEQVASVDGVTWADRTAADLESEGYAFGTAILPAVAVGAPHRRDRFYFVAHAIGADSGGGLADRRWSEIAGQVEGVGLTETWNGGFSRYGRMVDGLPGRLAKAIAGGLGNAIVPQLAAAFVGMTMDELRAVAALKTR